MQGPDVVIIGGGIAGLATSLALHRIGIRSLVLESSDSLRATGFALSLWENAWKALEALSIADSIRQKQLQAQGIVVTSLESGQPVAERLFMGQEIRCVKRSLLLETLLKELPSGTVRYSSKLDSIEELGEFKLLHLADGTTIKAKVLIGCDGVNSTVAKWLGFKNPVFAGRMAIRALVEFKDGHDFGTKFLQFNGEGLRSAFLPCDDHTLYWFLTWKPSSQDNELQENPATIKQFVLNKLEALPDHIKDIIHMTPPGNLLLSPLKYRQPWELLWGNISKSNVCVAGDALHPMTPDLGQGGCSALEDSIILARCLARVLILEPTSEKSEGVDEEGEEFKRIEMGLKRFADERRWRSFELICTAYMIGFVQQSGGKIMSFLREKVLSGLLAKLLVKNTHFDCGKLQIS